MNAEQFKALEVNKQVEYINELLKKGDTVDNIRLTLGVGKNYIGNTFKSNGYVRDKVTKLYIFNTNTTNNTCNTSNTTNTINTNNTYNTSNTSNTNNTSDTCNTYNKSNDIKALESKVNSLENELNKLKKIVFNNYNTIDTNNTCNTNKIIKYNSNNLVSRNYKIDKDVLEQFIQFCKASKLKYNHNVSDLITNAILEYMNNHK